MNVLDTRRPYLSRHVRIGLSEMISRANPRTRDELLAVEWIRRTLDRATMLAPKAHDAQSPGGRPGRFTSPDALETRQETP
jgi:hypothetical protein